MRALPRRRGIRVGARLRSAQLAPLIWFALIVQATARMGHAPDRKMRYVVRLRGRARVKLINVVGERMLNCVDVGVDASADGVSLCPDDLRTEETAPGLLDYGALAGCFSPTVLNQAIICASCAFEKTRSMPTFCASLHKCSESWRVSMTIVV